MTRLATPLLLVAFAACGAPEHAVEAPEVGPALRAALVFEPPVLVVGEVTRVEIAVTTPPEHRVATPALPEPLQGFWLIGIEAQVLEKLPGRWIHRVGMRVRAREVGAFTWPALTVSVESPDGDVQALPLDARSFEVVSVFPEFPEQLAPFGLEAPPQAPGGGVSPWAAAGGGAAAALAAMAAVLLVRRRRSEQHARPARPEAPGPSSWDEARASLDSARQELDTQPVAAADRASRALRRYVTRRFGADAPVRTTEELAATRPPRNMRSRWLGFVDILERLDAVRFRPPGEHRTQLATLLDAAEHFITDSIPPEGLR